MSIAGAQVILSLPIRKPAVVSMGGVYQRLGRLSPPPLSPGGSKNLDLKYFMVLCLRAHAGNK